MTFLVTGATGTVGREVVKHLLHAGHHVRALTRNPANAKMPEGVEIVAGDLTAPEALKPALAGVTGVHLINFGGDDYTPLQTGPEIVDLATQAGVKRVTILGSGQTGSLEQAVEASTLEWTHLQPVEFMANMLEWAESIRADGVVQEPFGERLSAIVHEADIGAVAATVLVEPGHGGKTYPITGPEALTPPQMVRAIGAAIGRELRFIELSQAQARARWREAGYADEEIEFFVWMYGHTPEIGYTPVPTVQEVTGSPPRSFAQWAGEYADAFRA